MENVDVSTHSGGDVFQINEKHGRKGWIGAFVLATEIRSWGIIGFVHHIKTHEERNEIWIRLKWEEVDYIGDAGLIPNSLNEENEE